MFNKKIKSIQTAHLLLFVFAIIGIFTILNFEGTVDSGDSIHHYLFAKYAPQHPELYFNHWAKPLFVLLASPFAQFGFKGIKFFNLVTAILTMYCTYKCALKLNYKNSPFVLLFLIFSPLYYILTFSGLTEPLFALFLIWGVYKSLKEDFIGSAIIISFLAYIRSEGLIMAGVFALYFLFKQKWKAIPFLLTGSVVYGIAGAFVHHSLLWVFTDIPYSTLNSVYGHGDLFHFIEQLINVTGVPLYALFWIGFLSMGISTIRNKISMEESLLLLVGFASFIIAHSLFWYLGIFNSMGLKRVMIGIIPLIALISLQGFNYITEIIWQKKHSLKLALKIIIILYVVVFPFTENPSALHKQDLELLPDQLLAKKTLQHLDSIGHRPALYNYYYLDVLAGEDYFSGTGRRKVTKDNLTTIPKGEIVLWDSEFCFEESGLNREDLDKDTSLLNLFTYKTFERNREYCIAGYEKR